jgi:hypothetical protein
VAQLISRGRIAQRRLIRGALISRRDSAAAA